MQGLIKDLNSAVDVNEDVRTSIERLEVSFYGAEVDMRRGSSGIICPSRCSLVFLRRFGGGRQE